MKVYGVTIDLAKAQRGTVKFYWSYLDMKWSWFTLNVFNKQKSAILWPDAFQKEIRLSIVVGNSSWITISDLKWPTLKMEFSFEPILNHPQSQYRSVFFIERTFNVSMAKQTELNCKYVHLSPFCTPYFSTLYLCKQLDDCCNVGIIIAKEIDAKRKLHCYHRHFTDSACSPINGAGLYHPVHWFRIGHNKRTKKNH